MRPTGMPGICWAKKRAWAGATAPKPGSAPLRKGPKGPVRRPRPGHELYRDMSRFVGCSRGEIPRRRPKRHASRWTADAGLLTNTGYARRELGPRGTSDRSIARACAERKPRHDARIVHA